MCFLINLLVFKRYFKNVGSFHFCVFSFFTSLLFLFITACIFCYNFFNKTFLIKKCVTNSPEITSSECFNNRFNTTHAALKFCLSFMAKYLLMLPWINLNTAELIIICCGSSGSDESRSRRNSDRSKRGDDADHHKEFNEGKTFLGVSSHRPTKAALLPFNIYLD